jgi:hypothetical protein
VKDAIMFVVAAFRSGQILDLVTSSLKLGFAEAVNALVQGFRTAVASFWHLIGDGAMWKSLGTVLLGVATGFGAALLEAFQTPVQYLQAGIEWAMASFLKGLLKVPGMSDLLGFGEDAVDTDFGKMLAARKAQGADFFGLSAQDIAASASAMMEAGVPGFADSVSRAASKAGENPGGSLIDTSGLRESLVRIIDSISGSVPAASEAAAAVKAAGSPGGPATPQGAGALTGSRLDPVVTSLSRVGGGGYQPGMLDAQRENNRLTGETNRLLGDLSRRVDKLGGSPQASFG